MNFEFRETTIEVHSMGHRVFQCRVYEEPMELERKNSQTSSSSSQHYLIGFGFLLNENSKSTDNSSLSLSLVVVTDIKAPSGSPFYIILRWYLRGRKTPGDKHLHACLSAFS